MSQRFRRELRDKYTSAFIFLGAAGAAMALAAGRIGELPAVDRASAWRSFAGGCLIVGAMSFVALWRTTPWSEIPSEQRKVNWSTVAGVVALGGVIDFFIGDDNSVIRVLLAAGTGYLLALSLTFALVGLLRRWQSEDPAQTPADE